MTTIILGHVHVPPGELATFLDEITMLTATTRARDGCQLYAVAVEDEGAGRLLVAERWRNEGALDRHLGAPDTIAFAKRWQDRMRADVLKFSSPDDGRSVID